MKRVLVTGTTGFVGQHVAAALKTAGYDVTTAGGRATCDLHAPGTDFKKIFGVPDILIHLAWPDTRRFKEAAQLEQYLPGDKAFLQAMIENGVKHVFVSGTCYEYGLQSGALVEDAIPAPCTPYGEAKNALRLFLEDLQKKHRFTLQWGRLFLVHGPGQGPTNLLPLLDKAIDAGEAVFNMSGGEQVRDFIHVSEVARRIVALAGRPDLNGVFNIGTGKPVSVGRMVENHIAARGAAIALNRGFYPYAPHEPMEFWADSSKMDAIMKTHACDACGSNAPYSFYRQDRTPAFQNKLYTSRDDALKAPPAKVDLRACPACDLIVNAANDSTLMGYDADYNNTQDHSPVFRDYLEIVGKIITDNLDDKKGKIVEIGCGKGFFMTTMLEAGYDITGFDPAYEGDNPRITKKFFDRDTAQSIRAAAVVMRHTLEHIESPHTFLRNLASFMPETTQIFIEIPRFEWIAEKRAFWDIFHEHCNYFTERYFHGAFSGKAVIHKTFGDQYMVVVARLGDLVAKPAISNAPAYQNLFDRDMPAYRATLAGHKNNIVWGAGAKGIAFCNALDPQAQAVSALVDIAVSKQGRFVPITGHPTTGPDKLNWSAMGADTCLWIMNENYAAEIIATLPPTYGGAIMVMGERAPRQKTRGAA